MLTKRFIMSVLALALMGATPLFVGTASAAVSVADQTIVVARNGGGDDVGGDDNPGQDDILVIG